MNINPNAFVMWLIGGISGYLYTETLRGMLTGLLIALCVSLLSSLHDSYIAGKRRR